ncbi:hypothetical protein EDB81DRAFT_773992 [Dactylonectria macrodidyma]|uniref:Uncharacterized protein n=1 Tax=Dactylonectria macrodidyma TaxID=307937 RepID=A0A9P9FUX2_9HYPO|nr:hypothetical protein EDB81DRAFT_773992 [Dactylonectria macrodidyma]
MALFCFVRRAAYLAYVRAMFVWATEYGSLLAGATRSCFIENVRRGSRCGQGGRCRRRTECTTWSVLLMYPGWNRSTGRWFGASITKNIFMILYLYNRLREQCTYCARLSF